MAADAAQQNLAETRAAFGPDACPCMLAMACPLHHCGCWRWRFPWECDCEERSDG